MWIRSWNALGVELPVEEEEESVDLPVGEEVKSWLSLRISSFNFFMCNFCDFLSLLCFLGSLVTCFDVSSSFI